MTHLIGVLHGQEETFPAALIAELNSRPGCHAEPVTAGGVERPAYRVLIDRLSPRVPYFASYVRSAAGAGCQVLNDPFWALAQDRSTLGFAGSVPTVLLPSHSHPEGVSSEDLSSLLYPLPWQDYLDVVGLPAVLRPARLGARGGTVVNSLRELWDAYGRTGRELMVLQSQLTPDHHLMVLVAGEVAFGLGYDPSVGEYRVQAELERGPAVAAIEAARAFCARTGCALAGLEFALCGGRPVMTDLHLVPDLDWWSISEKAFTRVVGATADLALERANTKSGRPPAKHFSSARTPVRKRSN